jgi:hypothetical protein
MDSCEKAVDLRLRFQLANDARQRRPIVMDLCFLHPALPVFLIEKLQHLGEGLFLVVEDVGKSSSLSIAEEFVT